MGSSRAASCVHPLGAPHLSTTWAGPMARCGGSPVLQSSLPERRMRQSEDTVGREAQRRGQGPTL
eukprot:2074535-Alexandrium_andersonii.AAC.1